MGPGLRRDNDRICFVARAPHNDVIEFLLTSFTSRGRRIVWASSNFGPFHA
jgi:hypothetical protein